DDRHLLQLSDAAHEVRHQGVATLVVREDPALLLREHLLLLEACDDALEGAVEVLLDDDAVAAATGSDCRLVADVRELGAGEARRLARDGAEARLRVDRLAARVHSEDRLAAGEVRRRNEQLPAEAARAA